MKRRDFLHKAGIGSAAIATLSAPARAYANKAGEQHSHLAVTGPMATATVSFGSWASGVDRFPNIGQAPGLPNNVHALIPNEVQIKAGGTVNFAVSGFHLVIVYGDGTRPEDIDTTDTVPATIQPGPPMINDDRNRVYRGLDPTVLPRLSGPPQGTAQPFFQDRVEAVNFSAPGRYLVICGVLPHFLGGMYGYVKVTP